MQDPAITVFVRAGDPACAAAVQYLEQRGLPHQVRDVHTDPAASAVLFGRLGRVPVPVVQVGERLLVGYDPVQLARFLPRDDVEDGVSLGAAVRTVSADLARQRGLAYAYGVEVGRVSEDSAAAQAGVRPGDVITELAGYTLLGGAEQFRQALRLRRPGDTMQVAVVRADGSSHPLTVTFPQAILDAGPEGEGAVDGEAAPGAETGAS